MYSATQSSAGQPGSVEGTRRDPAAPTFSILPHTVLADRTISRSGKLILAALLKFARRRGECFPAVGTIARAAGLSESTVRRHLPGLVEAGLLSIRPTPSNPTGRVIVLDFANDPARYPVRVSDRPAPLGCQTAPPVRVSSRPDGLGCQAAPRVSPVEQKRENNSDFAPPIQRQRSEASAIHLDLIGTIAPPAATQNRFESARSAAPQPDPITLERAQSVMAFVAKGGPLRDAGLKHLTSDMIDFMRRAGGELAAFAAKHGATPAAAAPVPTPKPAPADESRVAAVVEAAKAITPGTHPRLVDRFADRMVSLLGDPGSRPFHCKLGHQLRGGSVTTARFEAAIRDAMASDAANRAAIFVSRLKGN